MERPFSTSPRSARANWIITPAHGGAAVRYVITSMQVVGTTVPLTTVYGTDTTTPRLLLQTCEGSAYRLLVHGVLV